MATHEENSVEKVSMNRKKKPSLMSKFSRTVIVRLATGICLMIVGAACGYGTFYIISDLETELYETQYESISSTAYDAIVDSEIERVRGVKIMSMVMSDKFPSSYMWPNVTSDGFERTAEATLESLSYRAIGLAPIVQPDQRGSFQAHAYDFYSNNPEKLDGIDLDDAFSLGIRKVNPATGELVSDLTGVTGWGSPYELFTPLLQFNDHNIKSALMLNLHAEPNRGAAVDTIIECADGLAAKGIMDGDHVNCGAVTDFVDLADGIKDISYLIIEPIFPAGNRTDLTGFIVAATEWEGKLTGIVPDFVAGLDMVLTSSSGTAYTFTFDKGKPSLKGIGDKHDSSYDAYKKGGPLLGKNEDMHNEDSVEYTVYFYPSDEFVDIYIDDLPLYSTLVVVAVILLTTIVFIIHDIALRREAMKKQAIIDTKRKFIRFVSHEIRTPLNTVTLGLKLVEVELHNLLTQSRNAARRSKLTRKASAATGAGATPENTAAFADSRRVQPASAGDTVKSFRTVDSNLSSARMSAAVSVLPTIDKAYSEAGTLYDARGVISPDEVLEKAKNLLSLVDDLTVNTESAINVLNDLLNYDKIEEGTMQLDCSPLNLWVLVKKAARTFDIQAKQKNISIMVELERYAADINPERREQLRSLRVVGDDLRLTQVLRNLISNALKFTPEDGTISLSCAWAEKGIAHDVQVIKSAEQPGVVFPREGSLIVSVTDSGAGLTASQLQRIFGEGVQFNPAELQSGQGSGLGLSIAKGLVEQHGGSLTVTSEGLGKGCTFKMELPVYRFNSSDAAVPDSEADHSPSTRSFRSVALSRHSVGSSGVKRRAGADRSVLYRSHHARSPTAGKQHQQQRETKKSSRIYTQSLEADSLHKESSSSVGNSSSISSISSFEPAKFIKRKLLIVDDAPLNRKMLARLMKAEGHICVEAEDGLEAIAKYQASESEEDPFDCILMDNQMPNCTGPMAAEKLRAMGCDCLIVGVSGNVLKEDVEEYLLLGANAVLPKPLNLTDLEEVWNDFHCEGEAADAKENAKTRQRVAKLELQQKQRQQKKKEHDAAATATAGGAVKLSKVVPCDNATDIADSNTITSPRATFTNIPVSLNTQADAQHGLVPAVGAGGGGDVDITRQSKPVSVESRNLRLELYRVDEARQLNDNPSERATLILPGEDPPPTAAAPTAATAAAPTAAAAAPTAAATAAAPTAAAAIYADTTAPTTTASTATAATSVCDQHSMHVPHSEDAKQLDEQPFAPSLHVVTVDDNAAAATAHVVAPAGDEAV